MTAIRLITIGSVLLLLAGCQWLPTRDIYICPEVPEVTRPALQPIPASELECLSDSTYRKITERDRQRREYCEDLELIVNRVRMCSNEFD
jgi:hypothetical protein